jgi:hypothetical protein
MLHKGRVTDGVHEVKTIAKDAVIANGDQSHVGWIFTAQEIILHGLQSSQNGFTEFCCESIVLVVKVQNEQGHVIDIFTGESKRKSGHICLVLVRK